MFVITPNIFVNRSINIKTTNWSGSFSYKVKRKLRDSGVVVSGKFNWFVQRIMKPHFIERKRAMAIFWARKHNVSIKVFPW